MGNAVMAGSKTRHFRWASVSEVAANGGTNLPLFAAGEGGAELASFDIAAIDKGISALTEMGRALALYGLKQLLSDRAADVSDTAGKVAEMRDTFADLQEGTWSTRKAGEARDTLEDFYEAMAKVKRITPEEAKARTEARRATVSPEDFKAWIKTLKAGEDVKVALATVKLEKAKAAAKAAGKGAEIDF